MIKTAISVFLLVTVLYQLAGAQCMPKYWSAGSDTNDTSTCGPSVGGSGVIKKTTHWAIQYPGQVGWYNLNPQGTGACCTSAPVPATSQYSWYGWPLFDSPMTGGDPTTANGFFQQVVTSVTYNCTALEIAVCSTNCNAIVMVAPTPTVDNPMYFRQYDWDHYCVTTSPVAVDCTNF
jgi:hypothetical protein